MAKFYSDCRILGLQVSARGAKSCPIARADGQKATFTLGSKEAPVTSPFGATTFGNEDTSRKTIEFNVTPEQRADWAAFDEWLVAQVVEAAPRIFAKTMSPAEARELLKPTVSQKDDFAPRLRCKINLSGAGAVRCWSAENKEIPTPESLRQVPVVPKVELRHLWIMGRDCGVVLQVTDLLVLQGAAACPF